MGIFGDNLEYWNDLEEGAYCVALEKPEVLVADKRKFFDEIR